MNELRSAYRLFLRTCSASVLHHPYSTKTLRKMWRPSFADAVRVTKRLQENQANETLSATERNDLETWLSEWNLRIDNVLALLYSSSQSRGLAHHITRNLAAISSGEQKRHDKHVKYPYWNGQRALDSPEYTLETVQRRLKRQEQDGLPRKVALEWKGLEEVMQMAEGRSGLVFGTGWWIGRTRFARER
ncbi:hypothetical protein HMN09_01315300 [Mycena chlorophos]|uniref:Uncharacterized protein n=1 Tax=Mycena chlorophos TaxID=658473 RepID=A0A8H6VS79_MYCCL|nr:hypothetical protein HMN09_01315300 [Mycena chlorophos]